MNIAGFNNKVIEQLADSKKERLDFFLLLKIKMYNVYINISAKSVNSP